MRILPDLQSNWKRLLIYAIIISGFVIVISLSIQSNIESNAPWQVAANAIKSNTRLISRLGEIHSVHLISENAHTPIYKGTGKAKVVVRVLARHARAKVVVDLTMHSGIWEVEKLQAIKINEVQ